jgi:hypothetical protein
MQRRHGKENGDNPHSTAQVEKVRLPTQKTSFVLHASRLALHYQRFAYNE